MSRDFVERHAYAIFILVIAVLIGAMIIGYFAR
jgi:hypothetical protein